MFFKRAQQSLDELLIPPRTPLGKCYAICEPFLTFKQRGSWGPSADYPGISEGDLGGGGRFWIWVGDQFQKSTKIPSKMKFSHFPARFVPKCPSHPGYTPWAHFHGAAPYEAVLRVCSPCKAIQSGWGCDSSPWDMGWEALGCSLGCGTGLWNWAVELHPTFLGACPPLLFSTLSLDFTKTKQNINLSKTFFLLKLLKNSSASIVQLSTIRLSTGIVTGRIKLSEPEKLKVIDGGHSWSVRWGQETMIAQFLLRSL